MSEDRDLPAGWPATPSAITLFVEDLAGCRSFYVDGLGCEVVHEDDASAVVMFGSVMVNLLDAGAPAQELVAPARPGPAGAGPRVIVTVQVEDVDAVVATLRTRGVELLNGPMDRPWGPRTASFRDPAGHAWEVAG